MDKSANRVTRKMVNEALRARGRDESLREGDGYFYFGGGEAVNWLSPTVQVKRLSDLTLDQWLAEFDSLLDREKKLIKMAEEKSKAGASKKKKR